MRHGGGGSRGITRVSRRVRPESLILVVVISDGGRAAGRRRRGRGGRVTQETWQSIHRVFSSFCSVYVV
jgi:hypothetical protein